MGGSEVVGELPSRRSCVFLVRATGTNRVLLLNPWIISLLGLGSLFTDVAESSQGSDAHVGVRRKMPIAFALGTVSVWWQDFGGRILQVTCVQGDSHGRKYRMSKLEQPLRHRWSSEL